MANESPKTREQLLDELSAAKERIAALENEVAQQPASPASNPVLGDNHYKVIFDKSPLGLILFNEEGAILDCNTKFEELMGAPREQLIGFNTRLQSTPEMRCCIQKALAGEPSSYDDEYVSITGGKATHLRVVFNPVHPGCNPTEVIATLEDVSERRQAERQLEHTLERLAEAQRIAEMGDWEWDIENNVLTWSRNLYAILELDPTQPPPHYKDQLGLYDLDDAAHLSEAISRAMEGVPYEIEVRRKVPSGKEKTLLYRGQPYVDAVTGGVRLCGTAMDITKRKEAEKELKDLTRLQRGMADNLPDLIWAKDLDGRYLFANRALCDVLLKAKDTDEPIGKTDLFFTTRERETGHIHTFGEICVDSDVVTLSTLQPGRFLEDGLVRGEYLALEVHKAPFYDSQGTLIGTVGAGRDVTTEESARNALAESERRYRTLYENAPVGIFRSSPSGRYLSVNKHHAAICGYDSPEQMIEEVKEIGEQTYVYPEERLRLLKLQEEKGVVRDVELCRKRRDGKNIWISTTLRTVRNAAGEIEYFEGFATDVTERKHAEEALENAKEQAEAASRAKSLFLANMSHELRTPLNGIMGMHQLLQTTSLNAEQREYVEMAIVTSKRLTNLLSDILDLSKVEAGKMEVLVRPFGVDKLFLLVDQLFRPSCEQKGIDLRFSVEEGVPSLLLGDSARLQQIFNNLVGNAIKFTEEGFIDVSAKVQSARQGEKTQVLFTVKDSGIGINEAKLGTLFEAFTQVDDGLTRKHQGAGLGLAIVKQLVKLLGGEVSVSSTPGKGTEFQFTLPFGLGETPDQPDTVTEDSFCGGTCFCNVLLVEDDVVSSFAAKRQLEKMGCKVVAAGNGEEALGLLRKEPFDVVLMDIQLPVMDGVRATRCIRNGEAGDDKKAVPIIAMTAYAMAGEKERFLEAGMNGYLAKPVVRDQLRRQVEAIVAQKKGN